MLPSRKDKMNFSLIYRVKFWYFSFSEMIFCIQKLLTVKNQVKSRTWKFTPIADPLNLFQHFLLPNAPRKVQFGLIVSFHLHLLH